MFRSVLIANRGEIACRVIRTAARMGVRTIAVYSEADAAAPHARLADEAHCIGPAAAADSYLNVEALLAAARASGAEAVHPGYGFLSENAGFAEACAAAGLVFVGPPPDAIRAMGLKDRAKVLMEKAGVPVVPGYHGEDQSDATLAGAAKEVGYPVLIKAVAGGGGKGMRRADDADGFASALASARREAKAAFGDDRVLIEKFVTSPRHIEIQVFGDAHGAAVHLFERDCSVQRRHQKIIEEAPAPGMPDEMRAAMGKAACDAARAIGYTGAGTVEFIADGTDGLSAVRFYFMEMNTRLQVEHPVTEMITGQDLVEWQFRVAAGEPLPLAQADISFRGHAIEARLYAEEPARGFLPSTGRLAHFSLPAAEAGLRIDAGVEAGGEVTVHYDPMIAKLIGWGETRDAARARLADALERTRVAGLRTNAAFLARLIAHPAFAAGGVDTGFLDAHLTALAGAVPEPGAEDVALAVLGEIGRRRAAQDSRTAGQADPWSPWNLGTGWRIAGAARETFRLDHGNTRHETAVTYRGDRIAIETGGSIVDARLPQNGAGTDGFVLDGIRVEASVLADGGAVTVMRRGETFVFTLCDPLAADTDVADGAGAVIAPMTGKVTKVWAEPGVSVRRGDPLIALEAMKMEHTLAAPGDLEVAEVHARAGDQVDGGTVLVTFAAADA